MRLAEPVDDVDEVLRRITVEPSFRALLEDDPALALAGFDLDADQLRRIEEAVLGDDVVGFGEGQVVRRLFGSENDHDGPPA